MPNSYRDKVYPTPGESIEGGHEVATYQDLLGSVPYPGAIRVVKTGVGAGNYQYNHLSQQWEQSGASGGGLTAEQEDQLSAALPAPQSSETGLRTYLSTAFSSNGIHSPGFFFTSGGDKGFVFDPYDGNLLTLFINKARLVAEDLSAYTAFANTTPTAIIRKDYLEEYVERKAAFKKDENSGAVGGGADFLWFSTPSTGFFEPGQNSLTFNGAARGNNSIALGVGAAALGNNTVVLGNCAGFDPTAVGFSDLVENNVFVPRLVCRNPGEGIVLTSPNGTLYKLTVDDAGVLTTSPVNP